MANYCVVTSESVEPEKCTQFAEKLKETLGGTSYEFVDYQPPRNRLPVVLPFDSTVAQPVTVDGRRLEFVPPSVQSLPDLDSGERWFVDLLDDVSTRRSPLDVYLPSSPIVSEILANPCPPTVSHSGIALVGDGVDSINVRCSRSTIVRIHLPSPDELFEEFLHEPGYKVVKDEKRSSYLPTIDRFGSIQEAASALSGISGEILTTMQEGTQLPSQIRGLCKLGGGDLPLDHLLSRVEQMLQSRSEREKRIAIRRFTEFARGEIPENRTLGGLLEYWADRSILTRKWELRCSHCEQTWFADDISIQSPIHCVNCGNRISLPEQVRIGYALAPAVGHSLEEGLIPVVQAGRFLRNTTRGGFMWLPGIKYERMDDQGDIDIVACCDGHLVFAECKNLAETPMDAPVWDKVEKQFLTLADVAIECGGGLAVLASRAQDYPTEFVQRIESALKDRIPHLLLSRPDMESGRRSLEGRSLSIQDVVCVEFPETPVKREGGQRTINFGSFLYTKKG